MKKQKLSFLKLGRNYIKEFLPDCIQYVFVPIENEMNELDLEDLATDKTYIEENYMLYSELVKQIEKLKDKWMYVFRNFTNVWKFDITELKIRIKEEKGYNIEDYLVDNYIVTKF